MAAIAAQHLKTHCATCCRSASRVPAPQRDGGAAACGAEGGGGPPAGRRPPGRRLLGPRGGAAVPGLHRGLPRRRRCAGCHRTPAGAFPLAPPPHPPAPRTPATALAASPAIRGLCPSYGLLALEPRYRPRCMD